MNKIKNNLKYIIPIVILIVVALLIIGYYYVYDKEDVITIENNKIKEKEKIDKGSIDNKKYYLVDIKGAVNNPGVYKLEENSRIMDVINLSGGLKDNADTSNINLSKKIKDEMFIIIYTKEEIEKYKNDSISTKKINEQLQKEIVVIDDNNDAQINIKTSDNYVKDDVDDKNNGKININVATKEELLSLDGIGDIKAQAIINYRNDKGIFNEIDDIKNVSGIGDSLFEKIKDYITV